MERAMDKLLEVKQKHPKLAIFATDGDFHQVILLLLLLTSYSNFRRLDTSLRVKQQKHPPSSPFRKPRPPRPFRTRRFSQSVSQSVSHPVSRSFRIELLTEVDIRMLQFRRQ
eukprot:1055734-Prorocentrum_minimum.AAC.2